ncbi:Protein casc1 [Kappamyces sp. JEL0680]|nr:Protein casc1 [Kappamyces sp. JEL0680]
MPPKKGKKNAAAEKEAEEARRLADEERAREEERLRKEKEAADLKLKEQTTAFFAQWSRFLECSLLPSPKIERDLNTYLMLWADEPLEFDDIPSLTTMYRQLPNAIQLLQQLEIEKAAWLDKDEQERALAIHFYMVRLVDILNKKWDLTTQQLLQHVDLYPRESTENFQIEGQEEYYTYGLWANLTKNPRHKVIEFPNGNLSCTVPKPLALENVGIRMIYANDANCGASFEVQEGSERMSHIGGILHLDLMMLPDPPKKIDSWTIRPILSKDGGIKRLAYPFKKPVEIGDDGQEIVQDTAVWLTQVSLVVSPHLAVDKSARVMFWDADAKQWSEDGLRDEEFDQDTGKVRFRTMRFAPHALVQRTYLEYPFKSWELCPVSANEATLHITGQANEVKISIREGSCQLMGTLAEQHECLKGWLSPSMLFKRMSIVGLNFAGPKSMNNVDLGEWIAKHANAEKACINGVSPFATKLHVKQSPSNGSISSTKCTFLVKALQRETPSADSAAENWKSVLYNTDYRHGEQTHQIAFVTGEAVDDQTRLTMDGNESKTVCCAWLTR